MRRVVAHAFVDDLDRPALTDREFHHFSRVLRLRPGETVSVSDGRGGARLCEWRGDALEPVTEPVWEPRPDPLLTVGFALTKGEHPEGAVQKLTEAGADRVVIMVTDRCVARWRPESRGPSARAAARRGAAGRHAEPSLMAAVGRGPHAVLGSYSAGRTGKLSTR